MLKRLLNRDKGADPSAEAEEVVVEQPEAPVTRQPETPVVAPPRKTKSMRDSDIKDELGRSAEEIAAEAAKEFDIDAVVRKAASLPDAAPTPSAPAAPQAPAPTTPAAEAPKHAVRAGPSNANAPTAQPAAKPQATPVPAPAPQPQDAAAHAPVVEPPKEATPAPSPARGSGLDIKQGHIYLPGPGADAVARTADARDAYWENIGVSDDDFITYPVSPQVMGAPAWPTHHQRFRIVRTAGTLIVASEGLSDPFAMFDPRTGINGFGLEVFMELEDLQHLSKTEIRKSWAFRAIEFAARVVAQAESISERLSGHDVLSMDLPPDCAPQGWVEPGVAEPAGALLNVAQPPGRSKVADMPLSPVSVVPVTPIFPEELESCVIEGPAERRALANDLLTSGAGHRLNLTRTSLR